MWVGEKPRVESLQVVATARVRSSDLREHLRGCSRLGIREEQAIGRGEQAQVACPNLQKLKDDAKLSDVSKTVTINYSTYYECAVKTDAWIEWYQKQQQIFNNIK